jgi:hypothetical protein
MNYKYELKKDMVIEANSMGGSIRWLLTQLRGDFRVNQSYVFESFTRTKKWIINNHPELFL